MSHMIITVPNRKDIKDLLLKGFKEVQYKLVSESEDFLVFEGVFSLRIAADHLRMRPREFVDFCNKVKVQGGYKRRRGTILYIEPKRTCLLVVRLSNDEYEDLVKVAEERNRKPRTLFRETLMLALEKRRER